MSSSPVDTVFARVWVDDSGAVAADPYTGPTLYMTANEAENVGRAFLDAANKARHL